MSSRPSSGDDRRGAPRNKIENLKNIGRNNRRSSRDRDSWYGLSRQPFDPLYQGTHCRIDAAQDVAFSGRTVCQSQQRTGRYILDINDVEQLVGHEQERGLREELEKLPSGRLGVKRP